MESMCFSPLILIFNNFFNYITNIMKYNLIPKSQHRHSLRRKNILFFLIFHSNYPISMYATIQFNSKLYFRAI